MPRDFKQIELGENQFRYEVRMESGTCAPGTIKSKAEQYALLRLAMDSYDGLSCGPHMFQSLKMWHDGDRWQLYMEATGD